MKTLGKILNAFSLKFLLHSAAFKEFLNAHMLEFFYALHSVRVNTGMQTRDARFKNAIQNLS